MDADTAREIIGTRFLADPSFVVSLDGTLVTFDDIPTRNIKKVNVDVPGFGAVVQLVMIDSQKADRTTRQHGIAWRVNSRLVGNPGWVGFDHERILDGRSTEAERFQFIVSADIFESAVQPDWSGFLPNDPAWEATRPAVHAQIKEYLSTFSADRRREAKHTVREHLVKTVRLLPPVGRERWSQFVDEVIDNCPSISTEEVGKVAGILANLELSTSKFGLVGKLHELQPGDLDPLYELLDDWTLQLAKDALDEIQTRLKLIEDLDKKLRDETMDEVGDLQPLFERRFGYSARSSRALSSPATRG